MPFEQESHEKCVVVLRRKRISYQTGRGDHLTRLFLSFSPLFRRPSLSLSDGLGTCKQFFSLGVIFGKGSIVEKENKIKTPFTGVAGGRGSRDRARACGSCGGSGLS